MRHRGSKKRKTFDSQPFAAIPRRVIESEAYRECPDYAVRVLLALLAQYSGSNNGDLSVTRKNHKQFGIRSPHQIFAGFKVLEAAGLIIRTRQGGKPPVGCSLYGVTWRPLNPCDKFDASVNVAERPSDDWRGWTKPEGWEEFCKQAKRSAKGSGVAVRARARAQGGAIVKTPAGGRASAQDVGTSGTEFVPQVVVPHTWNSVPPVVATS